MDKLVYLLVLLTMTMTANAAKLDNFFISLWCGPAEFTQETVAQVVNANFNVVMVGSRSHDDMIKALDLCQANSIKGFIVDQRIYNNNHDIEKYKANLDAVMKDYAGHPALWGYYVKDEPNSSQFDELARINQYLLQKDPKHVPFINLLPTYASDKQLGNFSYDAHVDEYLRVVQPRMLSYDHYALFTNAPLRTDYFKNLEIIRRQGIKHNTPFNSILLSVPHGPYRDPSEIDLRWQVNTALAYGAKGIMYFTYITPHDDNWNFHDAIIDQNGKPTAKYEWAKKINGEVKKLAPTLMKLSSVAVYHTGTIPRDAKALPEGGLIAKVDGGEFVVGQFNSTDSSRYAMFVNKSFDKTTDAKIVFSQPVALYEVNPATGRERKVIVNDIAGNSTWSASFKPGQQRLVRIKLIDNRPVMYWEDKIVFRPRLMLNPSNQYGNRILGENKEELYNEGRNMFLIALKVKKYLDMDGRIDTFITRNTQTQRTTLGQETRLTKALNCDLIYALHSDATGTDEPGGGQWTFYTGDDGKQLGTCVENKLLPACRSFHPDIKFLGVREHWYRLWVLNEGGCHGALTEFLFHTNPEEREMLKDPVKQDIMAKAVADGILEYFGFKLSDKCVSNG